MAVVEVVLDVETGLVPVLVGAVPVHGAVLSEVDAGETIELDGEDQVW